MTEAATERPKGKPPRAEMVRLIHGEAIFQRQVEGLAS